MGCPEGMVQTSEGCVGATAVSTCPSGMRPTSEGCVQGLGKNILQKNTAGAGRHRRMHGGPSSSRTGRGGPSGIGSDNRGCAGGGAYFTGQCCKGGSFWNGTTDVDCSWLGCPMCDMPGTNPCHVTGCGGSGPPRRRYLGDSNVHMKRGGRTRPRPSNGKMRRGGRPMRRGRR